MSNELDREKAEELFLKRVELYKKKEPKKSEQKKRRHFKNPFVWVGLLSLIPIFLTVIVMSISGRLETLTSNNIGEILELGGVLEQQHLLSAYDSRFVLLGGVWTVFVLLALAIFLITFRQKKKRSPEDESEN